MARLSRKERQRRASIAAGIARYWRQVRKAQRQQKLSTAQARKAVKDAHALQRKSPKLSFTRALERLARGPWRSPNPEGEFAFNLRDRDAEQGFGLWDRFRTRDTAHVTVTYEYRETAGSDPQSREYDIEFDVGEDEDEFWRNYHAAIREGEEDARGDLDLDSGEYERWAIAVSGLA
jgi:hypothetical protein